MNAARDRQRPTAVSPGELLSSISALLLLVFTFLFKWYGIDGVPGRSRPLVSAENGWHGLSVVRWVILLTIAITLGSVLAHSGRFGDRPRPNTGPLVMTLGSVTAVLIAYRVLIALPTPDRVVDQKLGALLALLSAIGIALGGARSVRSEPGLSPKRSTESRDPAAPTR